MSAPFVQGAKFEISQQRNLSDERSLYTDKNPDLYFELTMPGTHEPQASNPESGSSQGCFGQGSVSNLSGPALTGQSRRDMDHLVQEIKENLKLGGVAAAATTTTTTTTTTTSEAYGPNVSGPLSPVSHGTGGGKVKGSGLKSRNSSYRVRSTPYSVPPSRQCDSSSVSASNGENQNPTLAIRRKQRWGRRRYPSTCMNNNAKYGGASASALDDPDAPDDPFAMLQELISDGSLIKEAVRRLQLGDEFGNVRTGRLTPNNGSNNKASGRHTAYDSDDEDCRTPPDQIDLIHGQESANPVAGRTFPCCEVGL